MSLLIPVLIAAGAIVTGFAVKGKKGSDDDFDETGDDFSDDSLFSQDDLSDDSIIPKSEEDKPADKVVLPWPHFPQVKFYKGRIGDFSSQTFMAQIRKAMKTKDASSIKAAYRKFLNLNNDQLRLLHNKFVRVHKTTPYKFLKSIKLGKQQFLISDLLAKLNKAGVGSSIKLRIK